MKTNLQEKKTQINRIPPRGSSLPHQDGLYPDAEYYTPERIEGEGMHKGKIKIQRDPDQWGYYREQREIVLRGDYLKWDVLRGDGLRDSSLEDIADTIKKFKKDGLVVAEDGDEGAATVGMFGSESDSSQLSRDEWEGFETKTNGYLRFKTAQTSDKRMPTKNPSDKSWYISSRSLGERAAEIEKLARLIAKAEQIKTKAKDVKSENDIKKLGNEYDQKKEEMEAWKCCEMKEINGNDLFPELVGTDNMNPMKKTSIFAEGYEDVIKKGLRECEQRERLK